MWLELAKFRLFGYEWKIFGNFVIFLSCWAKIWALLCQEMFDIGQILIPANGIGHLIEKTGTVYQIGDTQKGGIELKTPKTSNDVPLTYEKRWNLIL